MKKSPVKKSPASSAVKKAGAASAKVSSAKKPAVKTVKKAAPVKKAAAVKKAAPAKKAVAVKKAAAPAKKAVAVKKAAVPAKKAVAVKKAVVKVEKAPAHRKLKLTKAQKKHYRDLLMDLRRKFASQLQFHQDDALSSKRDSAGERAGMATHMADLGSDNFRHDFELGLMTEEGDVLEMIDEALQKIEDSEYGICIECDCNINPERLEAKPYARYCVRCKNRHEKMEEPHRRHR